MQRLTIGQWVKFLRCVHSRWDTRYRELSAAMREADWVKGYQVRARDSLGRLCALLERETAKRDRLITGVTVYACKATTGRESQLMEVVDGGNRDDVKVAWAVGASTAQAMSRLWTTFAEGGTTLRLSKTGAKQATITDPKAIDPRLPTEAQAGGVTIWTPAYRIALVLSLSLRPGLENPEPVQVPGGTSDSAKRAYTALSDFLRSEGVSVAAATFLEYSGMNARGLLTMAIGNVTKKANAGRAGPGASSASGMGGNGEAPADTNGDAPLEARERRIALVMCHPVWAVSETQRGQILETFRLLLDLIGNKHIDPGQPTTFTIGCYRSLGGLKGVLLETTRGAFAITSSYRYHPSLTSPGGTDLTNENIFAQTFHVERDPSQFEMAKGTLKSAIAGLRVSPEDCLELKLGPGTSHGALRRELTQWLLRMESDPWKGGARRRSDQSIPSPEAAG